MFANCTQLTSAPALPATKLAEGCYYGMFGGCTQLTSAPVLPATELAKGCYYGMFALCDNLTSSPELKATILVDECYSHMFYSCPSLSKVTMLATDYDDTGSDYFKDWLHNVAAAGTVYVKEGSKISLPSESASGIPSGWNVVSRQSSAGLDDFGFGGSLTGK